MNLWNLVICTNICLKHEPANKKAGVYELGGSYCAICIYFFKQWYLRCPCCGIQLRHSKRTDKLRNSPLQTKKAI